MRYACANARGPDPVKGLDSPPAGLSLKALFQVSHRDALGDRDAALLQVAYDTGAGRSELVSINVADIEDPDSDDSGLLFIPVSKTDRAGEGPMPISRRRRWRQSLNGAMPRR